MTAEGHAYTLSHPLDSQQDRLAVVNVIGCLFQLTKFLLTYSVERHKHGTSHKEHNNEIRRGQNAFRGRPKSDNGQQYRDGNNDNPRERN